MARKSETKKKTAVKRQPQASKVAEPPPKKTAQPRRISRAELEKILKAHERWLESEGKEGNQAELWQVNLQKENLFRANLQEALLGNADLQKANLSRANLEEAHLGRANLEEATLSEANLQKANLIGVNLQKTYLGRANLQRADLTRADLKEANLTEVKRLSETTLRNANLDGVTGLLGSEFARADVTGATLPKDIREFKVLEVVEETSKNARKIFFSMLLGCAYSWLTIATTTDVNLLTNSISSPLPIIQTKVPIASFYWAAPLVLMLLYVYLHFYLQRLWKGLATLPAIFPDGKPLDQRAYPWLLTGLVRRHFKLLEKRLASDHLEEWVTIFLAWWAVPITLLGLWFRYLPRHDWWGTGLQVGLLMMSFASAIALYRLAARTLRGEETKPFSVRTSWRDRRTYQGIATVLFGALCWAFSYGAINGHVARGSAWADSPGLPEEGAVLTNVWTWLPGPVELYFYMAGANFYEQDVSTRPANFWQLSAEDAINSVKGARLARCNLRHTYAWRAFLVNADLRWANLEGAFLVEADLRGADLRGANLRWAILNNTNLQGADLTHATLQRADFQYANLSGANFKGAKLQGAQFVHSSPAGVYLPTAAQGLTQEQLDEACGDSTTILPPSLSVKPCPK